MICSMSFKQFLAIIWGWKNDLGGLASPTGILLTFWTLEVAFHGFQEDTMRVTSVKFDQLGDAPVLALASVVFDDCFVVHNVRLLNVAGKIILAMPSRKATKKCQACSNKNIYTAAFCNTCGAALSPVEPPKTNFDIAHPVSKAMRRELEDAVFSAYMQETRTPGSGPCRAQTALLPLSRQS
jgi:DNA-binding cell septation regulator SpoVG